MECFILYFNQFSRDEYFSASEKVQTWILKINFLKETLQYLKYNYIVNYSLDMCQLYCKYAYFGSFSVMVELRNAIQLQLTANLSATQ